MAAIADIETNVKWLRLTSRAVAGSENPKDLADLLFIAMREHDGQGLSAVQVKRLRRVFVMANEPGTPICLVNPVITKVKGRRVTIEGCLSLPGVRVQVWRPQRITIRGLNQYMKPVRYRFEGSKARRACHELDHLNGKLIIDYQEEEKHGTESS